MPTPVRRRLRLVRRGAAYAVAIVLVLVAVLLGVASRLLPLAEQHPERIAAWLSERTGRPVAFDRVETDWTRRGPLLKLDNLRIGETGQALEIGDAEMLVSIYAGLLPGQALSELRLRGIDLTLEHNDDGRWQVRGLPGQQRAGGGDMFETLESLGELQVVDGKLAVVSPALGIDTRIPRIDLRLQVNGDRVRAAARAWPQLDGDPLDAVFSLERSSGDGRAYAGARQADLAAWRSLLRLAGVQVRSGQGRAEGWAELRGRRITALTVDAALDEVALGSSMPSMSVDDGGIAEDIDFGRVEARARWQATDAGWRLDAPMLRFGSGNARQSLDGLTVAGGRQFALLAERVDLAPLLSAAVLSDRLAPSLRDWLRQVHPRGVLHDIRIGGERGGTMHASARIERAGFDSVAGRPGLDGLGGMLEGDQSGFSLQLDSQSPVRFDWPSGFGVTHVVKLKGIVSGWRAGEGWQVGTGALRIDGGSFAADMRGGLRWQGDGSRPWIDIAAALDDAQVPVAKGFWVRNRMPASAVEWLDAALVGGSVRGGRAVISGDLDDWPFNDNDGLFKATARIEQGVVQFQPDWPAVENLDADVAFIADGFEVEGSGELAGVGIGRIQAGIDHYKGGRLAIDADGGGDAGQLLELLRQSPLNDDIGEHLAAIEASGPARVGFGMRLPLQKGNRIRIDGTVDVDGAKLADPRWDVAFDQVRGRAHYTRTGFTAESLAVHHEGLPGTLALRAGDGHVRNLDSVFEAGLQASVPVSELVRRVPDLGWLGPHMSGRSTWNVGVTVPKAREGRPTVSRLRLESDLVGTGLDLPAPMSKPADEALATSVETPLPLGSDDILVALGDRMAVRARTGGSTTGSSATGVRIVLGAARVEQAPPERGLAASGHAGKLDAIDWIALTRGGSGGSEGSMPLQRIDVTAADLRLLGGTFPGTRVVVAPAAGGVLEVDTSGESLRGRLSIPANAAEPITGRFERVHWRPFKDGIAAVDDAGAPDEVTPATVPIIATADEDALNPSSIPPLAINIADFRLNDAVMGEAVFRSQPTATGMHIEQLQTRAGKQAGAQAIDVSGDWSGTGAAARTQLALDLRSGDFGRLIDGLGMGLSGVVGGGRGTLRFEGTWPGSPAAFSAASLDGRMEVDLRDGQLVEVEPGAGRVLGLLSIAQLPRRLMLDFGDFFAKGFAFNNAGGSVVFADGHARSDNLAIDGPSAAISISGATDLRSEQFDQTIEVRPKTGNLLTVAGALAGGPVGAAIGAAANVVLEKPLGQMAAKTYRVTGPWKEPKVEVQGRAPAVADVPAG